MSTPPRVVATLALALTLAGCGAAADPTVTAAIPLDVAPAGFDLAVGDDQRFLAGLLLEDGNLVLGGQIELQLFYLGSREGEQSPEPVAVAAAQFLPVPGKEPEEELAAPTAVSPAQAAGVYEASLDFDRAGVWGVGIRVQLDDGQQAQGTGTFAVAEEHQIPDVGDQAPVVDNATVDSDVPAVAIDSRAGGGDGQVPDPALHDVTVAGALAQGRPTVVVVSTPTYCVSRFCGPITETVEALSDSYGDVAEFVHLEVWEDFAANELNEAAARWIQTEDGGNEPWVFLIGADGDVAARWDNVLDEAELVDELQELARD